MLIGIVRAGHPPCRGRPIVEGNAGPGVEPRRVAGGLRRVELPEEFAGERIVGRDIAVDAAAPTGASSHHFSIGHDRPGAVSAGVGLRFPPHFARAGIQAHHVAVRGGGDDHIFVNRDRFRTRIPLVRIGILTFVFPDQVARGGVQRQNVGSGLNQIHDAVTDDRNTLLRPVARPSRPGHPEPVDVAAVDLVEWAVALGVRGTAECEPVGRVRIFEVFGRHIGEVADLSEPDGGNEDEDQKCDCSHT